jgi:hypothetical protein
MKPPAVNFHRGYAQARPSGRPAVAQQLALQHGKPLAVDLDREVAV